MEIRINIIEKEIKNLLKKILDLQNIVQSLKEDYQMYSDDLYCNSIPPESFYNLGKSMVNREGIYYISSDSESESEK